MSRIAHCLFALLLGGSGASAASAQDAPSRVQGRVEVYVDDDATTVVRPRVSARAAIGSVVVGAAWMADIVSSASIDVATRASKAIDETRHEVRVDTRWVGQHALDLGVSYTLGLEPDYVAHTLALQAARDLGDARLWHGTAALSLGQSTIGTVVDPRFEERAYALGASLSLARIVDAATVLRGTFELGATLGFQSSPYRTVRLGQWSAMRYSGDDPDVGAWVFTGVTGAAREHHPSERVRARLGVDGVRDLGAGFAAATQIAAYVDGWGLVAGELSAELRWEPVDRLLVRLGARAYAQTGAWFYRARYVDVQQTDGYATDDKELGPLRSYAVFAVIALPVGPLRFEGRVEGTRYELLEHTLLPEKHALVFQLAGIYTP